VLNRKVSATYGVSFRVDDRIIHARIRSMHNNVYLCVVRKFVPGDLKRRDKKKDDEDVQSYTTMPAGKKDVTISNAIDPYSISF
jgi:hypothetical protein